MNWFAKAEKPTLSVHVDKNRYTGGDIVSVDVQLDTPYPIDVSKMEVRLYINEVVVRYCSDGIATNKKHPMIEEQTVQLLSVNEGGREFRRDTYHFHAKFQIPGHIPLVSIEMKDGFHTYTSSYVEARLWIPNKPKTPKFTAQQQLELALDAVTRIRSLHSTTNYKATGKSSMVLLGASTGLHCSAEVELDRAGFLVGGTTVATIKLHSPRPKAKIQSVHLIIVEERYYPLDKFTQSSEPANWEIPLEQFHEIQATDRSTTACHLEGTHSMELTQQHMDDLHIHEGVRLNLLTITHRLALKVQFAGKFQSKIMLDSIQFCREEE